MAVRTGGTIATTDGRLAFDAVTAMREAGVGFAVLHKEAELAAGRVRSDVDLVVDRPMRQVVEAAAGRWREHGLHPVVAWPYDVGGTGSVFLATDTADGGVQLDLLHDREGGGKYGARSGYLLEGAVPGDAFPSVRPLVAAAYLVVKRHLKGTTQLAVEIAGAHDGAELREAADRALVPSRAAIVEAVVEGVTPPTPTRFPAPGRLVSRLLHPVGAWLCAPAGGRLLVERFARFLPHARLVSVDRAWDWVRTVAPVRWRPGIAVSAGVPAWPRPDVMLDRAGDVEVLARQAVHALSGRLLAR